MQNFIVRNCKLYDTMRAKIAKINYEHVIHYYLRRNLL